MPKAAYRPGGRTLATPGGEIRLRLLRKQPPPHVRLAEQAARRAEEARQGARANPPRRSARIAGEDPVGAPQGHYDVLGIRRASSVAEVREGYRRRALATHPDKGGRPEDFRAIVAAFEVLSSAEERAKYDATLSERGSLDGAGAVSGASFAYESRDYFTPETSTVARGAAREELLLLLAMHKSKFASRLKEIDEVVLKAMEAWLVDGPAALRADSAGEAAAESTVTERPASGGLINIQQDKQGRYSVEMSWAGMRFRTFKTYSLAEAIDWHIALTQLKGMATTRLRDNGRVYNINGRISNTPGKIQLGRGATDKWLALTETEYLSAVKASPSIRLVFISYHGWGKHRIITPGTHDLATASKIQAMVSQALDDYSLPGGKNKMDIMERIKKLKTEAAKMVDRERNDRLRKERDLVKAVLVELEMRSSNESRHSTWRREAFAALELRDALNLDHASACIAVKRLRNLPTGGREERKALLLGDRELPGVDQGYPALPVQPRPPSPRRDVGRRHSTASRREEPPAEEEPAKKSRRTSRAERGRDQSPEAPEVPRRRGRDLDEALDDVTYGEREAAPSRSARLRSPSPPPPMPPPRRREPAPAVSVVSEALAGPFRMPLTLPSGELREGEVDGDLLLRAPWRYLSLPEWCFVKACSTKAAAMADSEVKLRCEDFVYSDGLFQWERQGRTGRTRPTPQPRLASRLTRFLGHARFSPNFVHLDLSSSPSEALQDRQLHAALSRMQNLADVVFPQHGWAGEAERRRFLGALPPGTSAWGRGR